MVYDSFWIVQSILLLLSCIFSVFFYNYSIVSSVITHIYAMLILSFVLVSEKS